MRKITAYQIIHGLHDELDFEGVELGAYRVVVTGRAKSQHEAMKKALMELKVRGFDTSSISYNIPDEISLNPKNTIYHYISIRVT